MRDTNNIYARKNYLICVDWTACNQNDSISAGRNGGAAPCASQITSRRGVAAPREQRRRRLLLPPHHTSTSPSISLPSASLPPSPDTSGQGAPRVTPHWAPTVTATTGTLGRGREKIDIYLHMHNTCTYTYAVLYTHSSIYIYIQTYMYVRTYILYAHNICNVCICLGFEFFLSRIGIQVVRCGCVSSPHILSRLSLGSIARKLIYLSRPCNYR